MKTESEVKPQQTTTDEETVYEQNDKKHTDPEDWKEPSEEEKMQEQKADESLQ